MGILYYGDNLEIMRKHLDIRLPTDRNYVFTSRRGRMSYENIRQRMARVASMVGVRFHNHMARHAYAT